MNALCIAPVPVKPRSESNARLYISYTASPFYITTILAIYQSGIVDIAWIPFFALWKVAKNSTEVFFA
jgi:hypothetical protein